MKVLRRSLHKDKDRISSPTRSSFTSSTSQPTQPFASLAASNRSQSRSIGGPPMMVIRATANYKANRIVELSFQKGDFFHVVGEREDAQGDWFEASNPATGARGIVPKHAFELFGKKQKQSPQLPSPQPLPQQLPPLLRSSAPGLSSASKSPIPLRTPLSAEPPKSAGSKTQPLYGIVQHDFVAERPDELDAKRGEPIIVIAQSNHEWFVAKPIGRLGGPGLIPVSFVEVQDVTTGKPLGPEQVKELIMSAVVPKVEEWKKATAAYKGNSIPLGKFDFGSAPPLTAGPSQTSQTGYPNGRSASGSHSRQQSSFSQTASRSQQHGSWHGTGGDQEFGHAPQGSADPHMSPYPPTGWPGPAYAQRPGSADRLFEDAPVEPEPEGDGYATVEELRERYGVVVHASVESFHHEQGHFWFHLRAHFSRVDGAREETTVLVLYRLYEDFFDFQAALTEAFPVEAGAEHLLPNMPGPTDNVDELVCAQRVEELSMYLHELCGLPLYIRECELVYEFLGPREGDVELEGDPGSVGAEGRSQMEAEGEVVEYLQRMDPNHSDGQLDELNESIARLSAGSPRADAAVRQRDSSHSSRHSRGSGGGGQPLEDRRPFSSSTVSTQKSASPPHHLSTSSEAASTLPSAHTSASSTVQPGMRQAAPGTVRTSLAAQQAIGGFLRIKIYQRQTDDLIAIRAPTGVRFSELLQRIRDRIGPEVSSMRYRDESGVGYSTGGSTPVEALNGARLVGIDNDEDLERWLGSGSRLVLYVD